MPVSGSAERPPRTSSRSASSSSRTLSRSSTGGSADTLSSSRPSSSSTRGMERNRFSSTLFPPRARHAVRRAPTLQFAFTLSERPSPVKKNQNRSLNQPCSSGFSIVHKSADRPVAANFQFLKISVSLGQLPVGACPPQALLGSSTANWKFQIEVCYSLLPTIIGSTPTIAATTKDTTTLNNAIQVIATQMRSRVVVPNAIFAPGRAKQRMV